MPVLWLHQQGPYELLELRLAAPAGASYAAVNGAAIGLHLRAPSGRELEVSGWQVTLADTAEVRAVAELTGAEIDELGEWRLCPRVALSGGIVRYAPTFVPALPACRVI